MNAYWEGKPIPDDPSGVVSNKKGTVTFATAGPDTRTTQMFVNYKDNPNLDSQGFSPVCEVVTGLDVLLSLKNPTPDDSGGLDQDEYESEGGAYIAPYKADPARVDWIEEQLVPYPQVMENEILQDTCGEEMNKEAPEEFDLTFHTSKGAFTASCQRSNFPSQVDRVFNLARLGYYSLNYFFRVVDNTNIGIVQFGTPGVPLTSNIYNYESPSLGSCGLVFPQPSPDVIGQPMNTNGRGWISMSTGYSPSTNTTWNATGELFVNKADNGGYLDDKLFVPLCKIDEGGMKVVDKLPTFGEVQELGGGGISLGELYGLGNSVITGNATFDGMGLLYAVTLGAGEGIKGDEEDTKISPNLGIYLFILLLLGMCGWARFCRKKDKSTLGWGEGEWRRVSMDTEDDEDGNGVELR